VLYAVSVPLGRGGYEDVLDVHVRRGIDDEENGLGDIRGGKGSITLVYLGGGFPVAVEAHFGKFRADGAGEIIETRMPVPARSMFMPSDRARTANLVAL